MSKFLITGAAGFIGFHLVEKLLKLNHQIIGLDNINDYYDINLKFARLKKSGIHKNDVKWNEFAKSKIHPQYRFIRMNLEDKAKLLELFQNEKFEYVINLAAQAGVRYSIDNPDVYIQSNIFGFFNILEACRCYPVKHLLYASSSSVYGNNKKIPFNENDNVDQPISLYAATKKSNELMAFTYNHLYNIPLTGLRFFTVYGPWGRPDMAVFKFTEAIINQQTIQVFGEGKLLRDYTYIDDIINGIMSILNSHITKKAPLLMNIGNCDPVTINDLILTIEQNLRKNAIIEFQPMQAGDVSATYADINLINSYSGFQPEINLTLGIKKFCEWYIKFNQTVNEK